MIAASLRRDCGTQRYRDLVQDLKSRGAWFATAGQAISWFRKRRSVVFESDCVETGGVRAKVAPDHCEDLPALRLRIHKVRKPSEIGPSASEDYFDMAFQESIDSQVACGVS